MSKLTLVLAVCSTALTLAAADERADHFETRVRPLLSRNCIGCHLNPPSAGLRLDSRESLLKGGASGAAITPGSADQSLLIQAVRRIHARVKMPPTGTLAASEIEDLVKWVNDGAVWPSQSAPMAALVKPYAITPAQRAYWAFQPVRDPKPPVVKNPEWSRTAVDRFVAAKLEEKGLQPAGLADRRTLIRRVSFDLTGLPPTPEEVDSFLADRSPDAFEKAVNRLLDSPHYGERWGRHWLDLVRYADTAGDTADFPVPQAHLYRDYVIAAFNQDKPYDQFLKEQIAGDLLPAKTDAEKWEKTVATGYLAIARRFGFDIENYMHLTIDDAIDTTGKSMLGLTVACARCHHHKYDPISSHDYYAWYGIFSSTRFPYPGCESAKVPKDFVVRTTELEAAAMLKPQRERLETLDAQIKKLTEEKKKIEAGEAPAAGRTVLGIDKELADARQRRLLAAVQMPVLEQAYAVADGPGQDARILRLGEPTEPGEPAPRRFLGILGGQSLPAGEKGSGRLQLAGWIASAENPLTARVLVNRIWQHHFGRGIVATPNDFGVRGQAPTHPELLDYLAARFVSSGWSIKQMHRLILLTRAYRMASEGPAANPAIDAGNAYLWKFRRRRIDAESYRDALLAVSGELDATRGGGHPFPHPAAWDYTQHKPFSAVYETRRRSVYLMTQRIQRHPLLGLFDAADANASTPERSSSTTALQALFAMNSPVVQQAANALALRVSAGASSSADRMDFAFRLAYGRLPAADERQRAGELLAGMRARGAEESKAWATMLAALLTSNEFLFVD